MQHHFSNAMSVLEVTFHCFCSFCSLYEGEAIGKSGSRVPYLRGRFTVEGLPTGVVFKKPFCYGARQCKAIMEAANSITFVVPNDTTGEETEDNPPESSLSTISVTPMTEDPLLRSTLRKVASDVNLEDITSGKKGLTEEDIEVEDCSLTQDERLTLYTKCRDFFDQDAWAAVGHNAKDRQGAVYKIKCSDCQASYIGETGRNLNARLTEHKRATKNGDANNHIAVHHQLTNHNIDWDSAQCLTYSTNYFQRLTLESWYTNLEQTPLNRCQQLPAPYKRLIHDGNETDKTNF